MSEFDKIQDRIDEYIKGTMPDKERAIFEQELRQNAELQHEVEVQISIADAVQAIHLRRLLQEVEEKISHPKTRRFYAKIAYRQVCFAAALAILLLSGNIWRQTSRIKQIGINYYAKLTLPVSRGADALDSLLAISYTQIGSKDFALAETTLSAADSLINEWMQTPVRNDETKYVRDLIIQKRYDAEWLRTLARMQQGKYLKVKAALKKIAVSESPYADSAKEILCSTFNIKHL